MRNMINFGYNLRTAEEIKQFSESFKNEMTPFEYERYWHMVYKQKYNRLSDVINNIAQECKENQAVQQIARFLYRIEHEKR